MLDLYSLVIWLAAFEFKIGIDLLQSQNISLMRLLYRSRKLALASLQSGNKKLAMRHARQIKLTAESREKCTSLLNRVEEVLNVIENAESTKKVA